MPFDTDSLRTARAAAVAAAEADRGLNDHGRRVLVAQSLVHHVKAGVKALRDRERLAQKLAEQAAAATQAALERLPVPASEMIAAVAAAARESADFRERLTLLTAMAGADEVTLAADEQQLVFALAAAPAGELFGLSSADLARAREARTAIAANTEKVIALREQEADVRREARMIHDALRSLEPDLSARTLREAGALAPRPSDLPPADSESWMRVDRTSWALAAAETDDAFTWRDMRPASETAAP